MGTVQTVIDDSRLDLLDYGSGIETTDTILLNYLNRLIRLLNNRLAAHKSDLLYTREEGIDCVADQNYVDISSLAFEDVIEVWLSTNRIEPVSIKRLYAERRWRSTSAVPYYWTLSGDNILFDADCASAYTTLIIDYWTKQTAVAIDGDMPYNDIFNDLFVQSLVIYARAKNQDRTEQPDLLFWKEFDRAARGETLRRSWNPKSYYLDF